MTHDEAMKLLGGYATNSLSEEERNALLAAALEDQELFDALEREQALKDVFDDRVARAEIRQALETPESHASAAWWTRWWAWGGASAAVAALALAVVWSGNWHREAPVEISKVTKTEAPPAAATRAGNPGAAEPQPGPHAQLAHLPARAKPKQEPAGLLRGDLEKKPEALDKKKDTALAAGAAGNPVSVERGEAKEAAAAAPVAPASPAPVPKNAPKNEVFVTAQSAQIPQVAAASSKILDAPAPRDAMNRQAEMQSIPREPSALLAGKASVSPVAYTLLRRDADGRDVPVLPANVRDSDAIRVSLKPQFAGTLSLYLVGHGVSSLAAPLMKVDARQSYVIPAVPLTVRAGDILRLELSLAGVSLVSGAQPAAKTSGGAPLSVSIPLGKP